MKVKFVIITLFFSGFHFAQAPKSNLTHKDSLNNVMNQYYELNLKVFQQNSTLKDIHNIFELFTDDFTYW